MAIIPDCLGREALEAGVGHQVKLAGMSRQDAEQQVLLLVNTIGLVMVKNRRIMRNNSQSLVTG